MHGFSRKSRPESARRTGFQNKRLRVRLGDRPGNSLRAAIRAKPGGMTQPDSSSCGGTADEAAGGRAPRLSRLILTDFRSYSRLDIGFEGKMIVATGDNGAGKTNLLEAISLFSAGRGLRRAEFADCARRPGDGRFAIAAHVAQDGFKTTLGCGLEPQPDGALARRFRVDREPVASPRVFADHLRLVWQTPAMDGLFAGPAGERRRFLDRLVLAVDAGHAARSNALERALRNRNRLLEDNAEAAWLDAAERELAELAIAVAAARRETVSRLAALLLARRDEGSSFPWAELALEGEIDAMIADVPALEAETRYRRRLRDNRARDAAAGRTLVGPQASDLAVRHGPKGIDARLASTGEQKALLTGLVLGHARLVAGLSGIAPIVLLDEIAAHFDVARRNALFEEAAGLGGQVWMTGADETAFATLRGRATVLHVTPGAARVEAAARP
jgi:DNA replication and repair protein RecF